MKEPWLAVVLSQVFPGLGHIYGERKIKGLIFLSIGIFSIVFGSFPVFIKSVLDKVSAFGPSIKIFLWGFSFVATAGARKI